MRTLASLSTTAVMTLLLAMVGCSEKATEPVPSVPPETTADGVPAEIMDVLESNTPDSFDPVAAEDQTWGAWPPVDWLKHSDVYAVTFLWGSLTPSVTPGMPVTDWSGKVWVNGLALVHPRRTIDFEPGQDSLLPDNEPAMAAWVSETSVDFDGISFLVALRNDVEYFAAPWLTFETEVIELRFDFGELVRLDALYSLIDGNSVAVHARRLWPARCPGGFLEGNWIKEDNAGTSGRIEGLWRDYAGEPIGFMIGQFWTTDNGERLFDGWVSGYYLDYIVAEFKGRWWYDDPRMCPLPICGAGHGWFRGHFQYMTGEARGGMLVGEFGDFNAPTVDQQSLPFVGVWHDFCPWSQADIGSQGDAN